MNIDPLWTYIERLERHIRQVGIRHTDAERDYIIAHLRRAAGITNDDLPEHLRMDVTTERSAA